MDRMFFVAVFGVKDKEKHIGTYNLAICPACEGLTRYEVRKSYRYLHLFFIPTIRWNVKYFVGTVCCGSLFELDPVVGKKFEKNPDIEIKQENLRRVYTRSPLKYCLDCKIDVPGQFSYCPYCGGRL